MRCLLLGIALAACTPHASTGPAWPKLHESDTDGGESLAPHESAQTAAVLDTDDDDDKPAAASTEAKPAAAPAAPEAGTPAAAQAPSTDEPIQTEDLIIEVDD